MRLSRAIGVAVGTSNVEVLGPSDNRVGIVFSSISGGNVNVANAPMTAFGQGFNLGQNASATYLDFETHGSCVKQAWHAFGSAVSLTLGIVEILEG